MMRSAPTLKVKLPDPSSVGLAPALLVKLLIVMALPGPVRDPAVKLTTTAQFFAPLVAAAVNWPAAVVPDRKNPAGAVRPPAVLSLTVPPPATTPIVPKLMEVFSVTVMACVQAATAGVAAAQLRIPRNPASQSQGDGASAEILCKTVPSTVRRRENSYKASLKFMLIAVEPDHYLHQSFNHRMSPSGSRK